MAWNALAAVARAARKSQKQIQLSATSGKTLICGTEFEQGGVDQSNQSLHTEKTTVFFSNVRSYKLNVCCRGLLIVIVERLLELFQTILSFKLAFFRGKSDV